MSNKKSESEAEQIMYFIKDDFELCHYVDKEEDLLNVILAMHKDLRERGAALRKIQLALQSIEKYSCPGKK